MEKELSLKKLPSLPRITFLGDFLEICTLGILLRFKANSKAWLILLVSLVVRVRLLWKVISIHSNYYFPLQSNVSVA